MNKQISSFDPFQAGSIGALAMEIPDSEMHKFSDGKTRILLPKPDTGTKVSGGACFSPEEAAHRALLVLETS